MVLIGALIGSPFVFCNTLISPILIDDPDTQIVLESIMRIFGLSIPFMFLSSVSFAANRSINNQNKYFICQLICNYGVHFGSFAFFKYVLGMGVEGLWYAYLASQVSCSAAGFLMILKTDWSKEAEKIRQQMAEGGAVAGH